MELCHYECPGKTRYYEIEAIQIPIVSVSVSFLFKTEFVCWIRIMFWSRRRLGTKARQSMRKIPEKKAIITARNALQTDLRRILIYRRYLIAVYTKIRLHRSLKHIQANVSYSERLCRPINQEMSGSVFTDTRGRNILTIHDPEPLRFRAE